MLPLLMHPMMRMLHQVSDCTKIRPDDYRQR
jgi:hypothetical protein